MRQVIVAALLNVSPLAGADFAAPALSRDMPAPAFQFPVLPGVKSPGFGSAAEGGGSRNPGVTAPLVQPPAATARPQVESSQTARLDDLFQQLAKADDATEADGLAQAIEHVWLQSGSDTADLLMVRSVAAIGKGKLDVASDLLDKIVALDPTWAEAWNKRATLRFMKGDDVGAMEDIAEVLVREPRHFGALSGMSAILQKVGMDKQALDLIRRTETLYPHNAGLEKLESELSLKVEGRDI